MSTEGPNDQRRRFIKGGIVAAPVVVTLQGGKSWVPSATTGCRAEAANADAATTLSASCQLSLGGTAPDPLRTTE